MVITLSAVGLGANLNNASTFNNIGSDDNVLVPIPDADITNMIHSVSGSDVDSSTITVRNTDNVSHSYKICVITKSGVSISDTAVITFTNPLSDVDFSNISIQEIS